MVPQSGQGSLERASCCISSAVKVWTADRFALSREGNAFGLDLVVIVLSALSRGSSDLSWNLRRFCEPEFDVPQTSHINIALESPVEPSSKFPQAVQKISDPTAVIVGGVIRIALRSSAGEE